MRQSRKMSARCRAIPLKAGSSWPFNYPEYLEPCTMIMCKQLTFFTLFAYIFYFGRYLNLNCLSRRWICPVAVTGDATNIHLSRYSRFSCDERNLSTISLLRECPNLSIYCRSVYNSMDSDAPPFCSSPYHLIFTFLIAIVRSTRSHSIFTRPTQRRRRRAIAPISSIDALRLHSSLTSHL